MTETLPNLPISQASTRAIRERLITSQFGQGYGQFAKDGPNSIYDVWTLIFDNITTDEHDDLVTFVRTVGCDQYWLWTPPGESTQKKWRIDKESYQDSNKGGSIWSATFTCTEQFDL